MGPLRVRALPYRGQSVTQLYRSCSIRDTGMMIIEEEERKKKKLAGDRPLRERPKERERRVEEVRERVLEDGAEVVKEVAGEEGKMHIA